MTKITILSEDLINKISAGEVVERPSSILKELVENAIDAEASAINVSISGSGVEGLTIEDNGIGMSKDEALLALKRYSTSKIKDINDLYSISTLGFRGEALPSIASVSKMKIETKQKDSTSGTRIISIAGEITGVEEIGCKDGTLIVISDVFFNTPARKKFLKSAETERLDCVSKFNRLACGFENISFSLHTDSKHIHYPQTKNIGERVRRFLDMNELIEVYHNGFDITLSGFISHPHLTKSNSQNIYTYVNNRSIQSATLKSAITRAYQDIIPHGKYPIAFLSITLPAHRVDVNVHPRKEEVKFANQNEVYQLIFKSIKNALINKNYFSKEPETFSMRFREAPYFAKEQEQMNFIEERTGSEESPTDVHFAECTIIGQYQSTYIVIEANNALIMIDQHAAAERITYEKLKDLEQKKDFAIQKLLFPEKIPIEKLNTTIVSYLIEELKMLGFNVTHEDNQIIFYGIPNLFLEANIEKLFRDLYEELEENDFTISSEETKKNILKTLSCHHSLRAHKNLNESQIRILLLDLDQAKHNQTCPHGRPIYITHALNEIERLFGRT